MTTDLHRTIERATSAWQSRWESEAPDEPKEMHRYRVSFTCDTETFETVKLALKGYGLAKTTYRVIDEEL